MGKRLDITPAIAAAISRSTDGSVDPATVAVFETAALNTLPLNKKGGLFDQARTSETTLHQMASYLNVGTDYAPLHVSHDQGYGNMPVGRTFAGDVIANADGVPELRALFYLPLDTGAELISKLDTSTIDEVSVGMQPQHINCSECGFDYLGADATFDNIWSRTCNNGHEIGVNGVHTILNGMAKFLELSLVSRGAAQKTKIMSRAKAVLGAEDYQRLAATGHHPEATILFATPTTKKESQMDLTVLVGELTTAKASVQVKDQELATAAATITNLTATNATLTTQVAELTIKADANGVAPLQAKLNTAEATATAALAFVREEADRLSVAAGLTKPAEDANLEALQASIKTARTKLQESLPVGGAALSANSKTGTAVAAGSNKSFKTR